MKTEYAVIIPVYKSNDSLALLSESISDVLGANVQSRFEIIFVDDASPTEESWLEISRLAKDYHFVRGYRLMKNTGKTGALLCGIAHARGDYIILMDDDLQHRAEDIPRLIEKKEHDIVIAAFQQYQNGRINRWMSSLKGRLDECFSGKPSDIHFGPFMMIRKRVGNEMIKTHTAFPYLPALLFSATRDVVNVPVKHANRKLGRSGFTWGKKLRLISNLLINNTSILLRVTSIIGIIFSLFSALLAIYFVWKKLFLGVSVQGWTSLVVLLLLIGGIGLFSLGIIGEYLLRIIKTLEDPEPYHVREQTED